jgi:hypothetical protein
MGDRALNEDEDNSDEEHENASSFQSPALIYALTQVKRVREQLAGVNICTQFTCFTDTKVQILT